MASSTEPCPCAPHLAALLLPATVGAVVACGSVAPSARCTLYVQRSLAAAARRSHAASASQLAAAVTSAAAHTVTLLDGAGDDEWALHAAGELPGGVSSTQQSTQQPPAACLSTAHSDVFLCVDASGGTVLSTLYRLCSRTAAALSRERSQRLCVPAYLALTCQHTQQPVVLVTGRPQLDTLQHRADMASRWNSLRGVSREGEDGWKDVRVLSHCSRHTHLSSTRVRWPCTSSLTSNCMRAVACVVAPLTVCCATHSASVRVWSTWTLSCCLSRARRCPACRLVWLSSTS